PMWMRPCTDPALHTAHFICYHHRTHHVLPTSVAISVSAAASTERNLLPLFNVKQFSSRVLACQMMRRLIPALFLVFYTVSAAGSSILRTQAWVTEHAREGKHHTSKHGARIGEWHQRSPHQLQTKLL